ncbi:phosphatase PAP2 family protein [Parapedobacter sp. ISTM3]|uniref:phosphatase PAP2 family protein n=1 Tax=Parapedobacter sp. ISTM3 TaxID=2800130 RepID=UPI001905E890|nr:phosphatase PAP2 family protein [Parapedobacter sp. ISTM3]MBK1439954.1 phosphatase PAP2 family protein [Parapedobacter sp. ISTM3]
MRAIVLLLFIVGYTTELKAQEARDPDSLTTIRIGNTNRFSVMGVVIPATFISYGALSLLSPGLKGLNASTRHETREHIVAGAVIDNYTQYAPAAAVYGLNLFGVKGKHNLKDRTVIYITSQLILGVIVVPTKSWVGEQRPDGSNNLSFPSGHTATAFSAAHFMFREYRDSHFWLSISGYPIAAMTGIYRIFNDKHWVGDVVAGAGIGILSSEIAYWLYPVTSKWFNPKNNRHFLTIAPVYQPGRLGLNITKTF